MSTNLDDIFDFTRKDWQELDALEADIERAHGRAWWLGSPNVDGEGPSLVKDPQIAVVNSTRDAPGETDTRSTSAASGNPAFSPPDQPRGPSDHSVIRWYNRYFAREPGYDYSIGPVRARKDDPNAPSEFGLGYSELLRGLVKSALLPGMVVQGKPFTQEDVWEMAGNVGGGGLTLGRAPEGALGMFARTRGYDMDKMAQQYPQVGPPILKFNEAGKPYWARSHSPESEAVAVVRRDAQRAIDAGEPYEKFFDVENRKYVDSAFYPLPPGDTLIDTIAKRPETIQKWLETFNTPEAVAKIMRSYQAAKDNPLAWGFGATGQLEDALIARFGPTLGRQAYRDDFAKAIAATTAGADPTTNLLMAHYGNFLRAHGLPIPAFAHEVPYPIGGRYLMPNLKQFDRLLMQGQPLTPSRNPKRFNFSANFLGDLERGTIDEQIMSHLGPYRSPPPGTYGIVEGFMGDLARSEGLLPARFLDLVWNGARHAKPMHQHQNEMFQRTKKVTGRDLDEVAQGYFDKSMPMYSAGGPSPVFHPQTSEDE